MKINVRDMYGKALLELANKDDRVVAFDADLSNSTKTSMLGAAYPERFFNMGISEQDMVATAAGMASCGFKPFVSTFCSFVPGRSFDQIRMCVAYPNLKVNFVSTHGGISVGKDGASHHANEDLSMMRTLPNMEIYVPSDPTSAYQTIHHIYSSPNPSYVRLFRDSVEYLYDPEEPFDPIKSHVLHEGDDVTIFTCGYSTHDALKAAKILAKDDISAQVIDMQVLRPFDEKTIVAAAKRCGRIITVEDHSVYGGMGGRVCEYLSSAYPTRVSRLGLKSFTESGSPKDLYTKYGLSADKIVAKAKELTA